MNTYFCPKCGVALDSSACGRKRCRWIPLDWPTCPECQVPVHVSGGACIVVGLLVWFLLSLFLCAELPVLGLIVGAAMWAVGLMRLVRQWRAWRRAKKRSQDDPEEAGD